MEILITIDREKFKAIRSVWHCRACIEEWFKLGYLEEVKENKETLTLPEIENNKREYLLPPREQAICYKFPSNSTWRTDIEIPLWAGNYYINWELYNWMWDSILEKLRTDLEERIKEYKSKLSTNKVTKQTAQDKILLIRINELEVVLIVIDSLGTPICSEIPNNWTQIIDNKRWYSVIEEETQFTPWQEIEVSNDNTSWTPWKYTGKILCNQFCIEWHDTWFNYARPIPEEVTIPEFK